ncbi:hypothetical protein F4677DRAFT_440448 [Hypoxylon crocopeplum]|nr:hypothetical protein F4677DRAFT_440448 [Hypoxylon crocopeplum]
MATAPYKPGDEERDLYYFGFAGEPKLVARMSQHRWVKPEYKEWDDFGQVPKRYRAICDAIPTWTRDVSVRIVEALKKCAWSYFFPVRIGFETVCFVGAPPNTFLIVLLIAVEEDSLQWEAGIAVALQCRDILREHEISDVEVEIREGKHVYHAASKKLEAQVDPQAWGSSPTATNQFIAPMLSYSGYPVRYYHDRNGEGTIGLHIKLEGDESTTYGLTCRHVVYNSRPPQESFKISTEEEPQYHVQASTEGYERCLFKIGEHQKRLEYHVSRLRDIHTRWEEWYSTSPEVWENKRPTERQTRLLLRFEKVLLYTKEIIECLKGIESKDERRIGRLAFHPNFEISTLKPGYLKDWALIELDTKKFLNGLGNKVFMGNCDFAIADPCYGVDRSPSPEELDNGFLTLTLAEEPEGQSSTWVGKRGAASGLTFGIKSAIEAVVRRPGCGTEDMYAWEMLIVPDKWYGTKFSKEGDSGSCVFDIYDGRIIGLVTGSNGAKPVQQEIWRGIPAIEGDPSSSRQLKEYPGKGISPKSTGETPVQRLRAYEEGTDITFVSPIEWVLEDIQDFTGLKPQLA